ncbi:MAG TPA: hypothetical protein VHL79_18040 [Ramlibacter sp.]|jgi:hypothetical protein|nr:hypothetical protein [Ramlibacter sp.]
MPLLSHIIDPATQQPRSRMWWVALGAIVGVQLFAFWLLCSHQVRKAEARQNEAVVQQMALADCLQYIPGSTIASCSGQPAQVQAQAGNPALTGAVPVSFSFR